jgi:hypothetical protein
MRSFVTSVSGPRSSPDPVRVCAQCSALPLRVTAPIQRPFAFAIQDLSGFYPITGRRLMQSFCLAPLPPPRSPQSPIHVVIPPSTTALPCGRWTCSQRAAKGLTLESCEAPQSPPSFYPRHRSLLAPRQPVSPRPPPTSTEHRAHRFAWWSPLLVPCSVVSMIFSTLNLLLLLGVCLFCSIPSSSLISWDL